MIPATWLLPVASKELAEMSGRRSMYIARVLFACFVYGVVLSMFFGREVSNPQGLLGLGADLFEWTMMFGFVAIYVVVPAMMANIVTLERERGALPLLLLTRLRPTRIVFEKFLSRSVLLLTFVCLVVPLFAVAYAHGGITTDRIASGAWVLSLATLHHGAFCILASACARTTTGALVAGYLAYPVATIIAQTATKVLVVVFLSGFVDSPTQATLTLNLLAISDRADFSGVVLNSISLLLSMLLFLFLAGRALTGPTSGRGGSWLSAVFTRFDELFESANRFIGGWQVSLGATTPDDDPVTWRETRRWSMASPNHLVRWLLVLQVPILLAYGIRFLDSGVWLLTAVVVGVFATTTFQQERTRGTLDVLLSTPIPSAQIVSQKQRSVLIAAAVFLPGLASMAFLDSVRLYRFYETLGHGVAARSYLYFALYLFLTMAVLLTIAWLGMILGLWVRNGRRGTATFCLIVFTWVLLAFAALWGQELWPRLSQVAAFVSPARAIQLLANQCRPGSQHEELSLVLSVGLIAWYALAFLGLRSLCLWRASKWLGRP